MSAEHETRYANITYNQKENPLFSIPLFSRAHNNKIFR